MPRLARGPGEDTQGQPGKYRPTEYGPGGGLGPGGLPDVRDVEGVQSGGGEVVGLGEQVQDGDQETDVADAGNDKCLLGGSGRRRTLVPETDQ